MYQLFIEIERLCIPVSRVSNIIFVAELSCFEILTEDIKRILNDWGMNTSNFQ